MEQDFLLYVGLHYSEKDVRALMMSKIEHVKNKRVKDDKRIKRFNHVTLYKRHIEYLFGCVDNSLSSWKYFFHYKCPNTVLTFVLLIQKLNERQFKMYFLYVSLSQLHGGNCKTFSCRTKYMTYGPKMTVQKHIKNK